jgi:hypothetical protein
MSSNNQDKRFKDYQLKNTLPFYIFVPFHKSKLVFDDGSEVSNFLFIDALLRVADGEFIHTSIGYGDHENVESEENIDQIKSRFRFDKVITGYNNIEIFINDIIKNEEQVAGNIYKNFSNEKNLPLTYFIIFISEYESIQPFINLSTLHSKNRFFFIFYGREKSFTKRLLKFKESSPKLLNGVSELYKLFSVFRYLIDNEDPYYRIEADPFVSGYYTLWHDRDAPFTFYYYYKFASEKKTHDPWEDFMGNINEEDL